MSVLHYPIDAQASGQFNNGEIIENKPIGFPQDGGSVRPYSSLFYWAKATALKDSTIGLHPHQGFEIMSFVLRGKIKHYDSQMRDWLPLTSGAAQIIRAGSGISHAEHMEEGSVMFQIWLDPGLERTLQHAASYSDYAAESRVQHGSSQVYASADSSLGAPMQMTTPGVSIYTQSLTPGYHTLDLRSSDTYSIYILDGSGSAGDLDIRTDDFFILRDEVEWKLEVGSEMNLFIISSPTDIDYKSYRELYAMQS